MHTGGVPLCSSCVARIPVLCKKLQFASLDRTGPVVQAHLDKLSGEITKTLEKITSREKYINSQVCLTRSLSLSLSLTHTHITVNTPSLPNISTSLSLVTARAPDRGIPSLPEPPC